jgi:hypothetical protein
VIWLYAWTITPEGSKSKTLSKYSCPPSSLRPLVIKAALFISTFRFLVLTSFTL